jgi:ATP:ADP antiporter, AAA family
MGWRPSAAWLAAAAAASMVAEHIAAKTARDALFLSAFGIKALPSMFVVAALAAIAANAPMARLLVAIGPARLVPAAFSASALLLGLQWVLSISLPRAAAVTLYLHVATVDVVLISWFWSLINERFDPRAARRQMRTIGGGATFGGLIGGLVAERSAVYLGASRLLLVLAVLHLLGALATLRTGRGPAPAAAPEAPAGSALRLLAGSGYLRDLAVLVAVTAIVAALIDYVFKSAVTGAYHGGTELVRFFGVFYTGTGLATFALQALAGKVALERLGAARTMATLPVATAAAAGLALATPVLFGSVAVRAVHMALYSSAFRSGYELLFTPLPPPEKRRIKTVIDVGFDRLGDALGGGLLAAALVAGAGAARAALLVMAIVLASATLWLTARLHRGYIQALARSLRERTVALDAREVTDSTTLSVLRSVSPMAPLAPPGAEERRSPAPPGDPVLRRIAALRSGDPAQVRQALFEAPLEATLVPHAIALLAWDEAAPGALEALRRVVDVFPGQLVDALLSPDQDFAVRRRLPRVLAETSVLRAIEGLLRGLEDTRFEVRYRCGRALARIQRRTPQVAIDSQRVFLAVLREATCDRGVWESRRLLDQAEEAETDSPFIDEFLRDRASRSLEHVFTLLSLAFPRQPLEIAFRGLHTADETLRGTCLEYLEGILPVEVREPLWPFLEDQPSRRGPPRPAGEVLKELLLSNESIQVHLEELRRRVLPNRQ